MRATCPAQAGGLYDIIYTPIDCKQIINQSQQRNVSSMVATVHHSQF